MSSTIGLGRAPAGATISRAAASRRRERRQRRRALERLGDQRLDGWSGVVRWGGRLRGYRGRASQPAGHQENQDSHGFLQVHLRDRARLVRTHLSWGNELAAEGVMGEEERNRSRWRGGWSALAVERTVRPRMARPRQARSLPRRQRARRTLRPNARARRATTVQHNTRRERRQGSRSNGGSWLPRRQGHTARRCQVAASSCPPPRASPGTARQPSCRI